VPAAIATSYGVGQGLCFEQRFYHSIPYNVCVVKATYRLMNGERLKLLEPQPIVVANDIPEFPDREYCSPRYVSDFTPFKPCTDIVVVGNAQPLNGQPIDAWVAELAVGGAASGDVGGMRKRLKLCGPRQWQHRLLRGWSLSDPEIATSVRLAYEFAYGGRYGPAEKPTDIYAGNPIGAGFECRGGLDADAIYSACQIEYLDDPLVDIDRPIRAAGFSPMPPYFEDRLQYSGTPEKQPPNGPGMPTDMDMRFWNVAPVDQRTANAHYLTGGESMSLTGFWPEGQVIFDLPRWTALAVSIDEKTNRESHTMNLDTVHIDLDKRHVTLRWCALVPFDLHGVPVREINLMGLPDELTPSIASASASAQTRSKPRVRTAV
jgi:hypothetical protein